MRNAWIYQFGQTIPNILNPWEEHVYTGSYTEESL